MCLKDKNILHIIIYKLSFEEMSHGTEDPEKRLFVK